MKHLKQLYCLLLIVFAYLPLGAMDPFEDPRIQAYKRARVWCIEDKTTGAQIYLTGTRHSAEVPERKGQLERLLPLCQVVCTETKLGISQIYESEGAREIFKNPEYAELSIDEIMEKQRAQAPEQKTNYQAIADNVRELGTVIEGLRAQLSEEDKRRIDDLLERQRQARESRAPTRRLAMTLYDLSKDALTRGFFKLKLKDLNMLLGTEGMLEELLKRHPGIVCDHLEDHEALIDAMEAALKRLFPDRIQEVWAQIDLKTEPRANAASIEQFLQMDYYNEFSTREFEHLVVSFRQGEGEHGVHWIPVACLLALYPEREKRWLKVLETFLAGPKRTALVAVGANHIDRLKAAFEADKERYRVSQWQE